MIISKNSFIRPFVAIILLLLPKLFFAQTIAGLKHYGVEDGLSIGSVLCLAQDKQGFIWVGTTNGLDRFDGYAFREFHNDPHDTTSLWNNMVCSFAPDNNGKMWIGAGNGINIYDPLTDKLSRYTKWHRNEKISKPFLRKLVFLDQGILLVTTSKGFLTLDTATGKFTGYLGMQEGANDSLSRPIDSYYCDRDKNFWFGTDNGELLKWERNSSTITHVEQLNCNTKSEESGEISGIEELDGHILILTTDCGVHFYDKTKKEFIHYFKDNAYSDTLCNCRFIAINKIDDQHFFLLGQEKLMVLDFENKKIKTLINNTKDESRIFTTARELIIDKQGMLWIGDYGYGVFSYNPNATQFGIVTADQAAPDHLKNPYVFNFCEAGDSVLIGSNWGLDVLKPKTGKVRSLLPYPDKVPEHFPLAIQGSIIGDHNDIWFLSRWSIIGLIHWEITTGKKTIYDSNSGLNAKKFHSFTKGPDGNFWIGTTDAGVSIFDPRTEKFSHIKNDTADANSISSNTIEDVFFDSKGMAWISTNKGLNKYDPKTKHVVHYRLNKNDPTSISSDNTFGVAEDLQGGIWIATDYGFDKLDEASGKFKTYTAKNGMTDNFVNGILADSLGYLWISTNKGLCSFDIKKETFTVYGIEDGLQDLEFNVGSLSYGRSGMMYFGGVSGMNYFDPKKVKGNKYVPPVFITSLLVNGHPLALDSNIILKKNIELDYTQNFLNFDFVTLNYYQASKNKFTCMMEGIDKDWVNMGKARTASYPNLPPGEYIFHVKACNNDGVWNDEGATLRITILPPFWRTKWFYTLCIILSITGIYLFIRTREQKLKSEKKILEEKVKERTIELEQQKELVEEKNKEVTDSITYAKRLQDAILPSDVLVKEKFPESFILYIPKDIIAGDFYWMHVAENASQILIAAADCTGHGVPGAMVSVVCSNALNRAVKEFGLTETGKILDKTTELVLETFENATNEVKDGMDISLLSIERTKKNETTKISWSGAHNPLWYITDEKFNEQKADKQPVGKYDHQKPFSTHQIELKAKSSFYLFTDGFADQFGGEKGKKFKYKQLEEKLMEISPLPMDQQKDILKKVFENWKGKFEQVDDVCIIGIRL